MYRLRHFWYRARMKHILLALLLAVGCQQAGRAQEGAAPRPSSGFPPRELAAIEEALDAVNLKPADLGYRKGPIEDAFRLPIVHRLLHDPLAIPATADALVAPGRAGAKPSDTLRLAAAQLPGGALAIDDLKPAAVDAADPVVARLAGAWVSSRRERELAFAGLSPAERALLEANIAAFVAEEEGLGFKLPPEIEKDPAPMWKAIGAVRWAHLWRSGLFLMAEVERAADALPKAPHPVRIETPEGVVEIAGVGHDRHELPAGLILDAGGDDTYVGPACQAWIADLGGHDRYRAGSRALGSGILDVCVVWDRAGDDAYEAEALAEGFGAFGLGALFDDGGNDTYRLQLYGQGASRTWGAGLLADRTGDDVYQAGGRVIHKPLLEKERATFGFAQGFSIGYRPDHSGGLAWLWDGAGDDVYIGGTYTQGASYWFSFSFLADDTGNDRYTAFYYSQASAMHLTVAALIDGAGLDVYACHMGAIHAIGHDWGVALLWDKGGNDVYAGDSAPCVGVANGIGIFVDGGGDDRYSGPPASANPARDSGSVALFLDLGGKDKYGRGLRDGGIAVRERWGVARDVEEPPEPAPTPGAEPQGKVPLKDPQKWHDAVGSRPVPPEEELAKLYDEASLWAVGSTRDRAWIGRRALIEIGLPAAEWMVRHRLAAAQSLHIEAFDQVFREIGEGTGKLLIAPLKSESRQEVENALRLVTQLKAVETREEIVRLLRDPNVRRAAIAAAGALQLKEAVPVLIESTRRMDPFGRLVIAKALGQIGDGSATAWLAGNFEGEELPVREASADALVKIKDLPALLKLAETGSRTASRLALKALGRIEAPEALAMLSSKASDADWGVRLSALIALKGSPAGAKAFEEAKAREKDARVLRALEGLDTSRDGW